MKFEGQVLQRGFWLYVWKISNCNGEWLYVGRTGDSSSANAGSPFSRIGQHLDFRRTARGNLLTKQLTKNSIDPFNSQFSMVAVGPLFKEEKDFEKHKKAKG